LRAELASIDQNMTKWASAPENKQDGAINLTQVNIKMHQFLLGLSTEKWRESQTQADQRFL
jgi:hypothetical protein